MSIRQGSCVHTAENRFVLREQSNAVSATAIGTELSVRYDSTSLATVSFSMRSRSGA